MKGLIVEETVYEGTLAFAHGHGQRIKRIVIPEADNLAITPHNGQIYIMTNYIMSDGSRILKETEVADELIQRCIEYKRMQDEFFQLFETLEKLF